MPKIVAAFVRAEVRQALAEERPERLGAATASGANEGLELREAELDGIEVRAVGWQVPGWPRRPTGDPLSEYSTRQTTGGGAKTVGRVEEEEKGDPSP